MDQTGTIASDEVRRPTSDPGIRTEAAAEAEGPTGEELVTIRFTVLGEAAPAGSKRAVPFRKAHGRLGVRVFDDSSRNKPWQARVAAAADAAYRSAGLPRTNERGLGGVLRGPLQMDVIFFRLRPKSHFGKRGLLPSAPDFPITKPDLTKLIRSLEDSLTGVLWNDDAQVITQVASKQFGEPARAEVTIRELRGN